MQARLQQINEEWKRLEEAREGITSPFQTSASAPMPSARALEKSRLSTLS